MTELFAGVIVVALVGNAAEHYSAIAAAVRNDMTLALEISIGSSAQIALMVAPLLVIIGPMLGQPMSLVFNAFELAAIGLSVATVALVALDGESNWLEGLQLLGSVRHPRRRLLHHPGVDTVTAACGTGTRVPDRTGRAP